MITIYVDTETSGLRPPQSVILEVAAVAVRDDQELGSFAALVNPGVDVLTSSETAKALEINKLDKQELAAASPAGYVAEQFKQWLMQWGPASLWAFNTQFDSGFLAQKPWEISKLCWGGCVMKQLAGKERYIKLSKCAERFALAWDGEAHRALTDARMAFKVHRAYLKHNGLVRV